ncbi:hypothetical protein CSAL01_05831 [Colletotrichum salicis]|uniref:FAD dependent oxidoreductase domain-containing protein n=1 Tax=Colletotrichum salicis TaxID=1209931 RepID=A0A135V034_9PEZI|nr:hypothetical protein CSAL01_05831 [Colletotrichum salicis]
MAIQMRNDPIVIIGAGIIGLDIALVLARRGLGRRITVIAEHLPGDTSINYTSPWAGANFSAISGSDENALRWDRLGYGHLTQLASTASKDSFVWQTPSIEYWDESVSDDKIKSMSEYLEDFMVIPENELPEGVNFRVSFTTVTINAPKHIETSDTFAYETDSILQRTSALSSELTQVEPEVLASFSGLRPSHEGGARVERVELIVDGQMRVLVHNYGASGTGFQAGYGMELEVVEAIEDVLQGIAQNNTGAKL